MLKRIHYIQVFFLYILVGWGGINLGALGDGSLTLIWLPAGVALAACLLFGKAIWPAIWAGSFVANTPYLVDPDSDFTLLKAVTVGAIAATINTSVQALLAYKLYRRFIVGHPYSATRQLLKTLYLVFLPASVINVALLVVLYGLTGFLSVSSWLAFDELALYWLKGSLADFHGYFVVVPIVAGYISTQARWQLAELHRHQWILIALALLILVMLAIGGTVYNIYLLIALGVIVAINLNLLLSHVYVILVSLTLTLITGQGMGPFTALDTLEAFLALILFVFSFGMPVYLLVADRFELRKARKSLETKVADRTQDLNEANIRLKALSITDSLTGIANRRALDDFVLQEWQRAKRQQEPMGFLMVDIDYFKEYNDHYGHVKGDLCLKRIAVEISNCIMRSTDMVARYGGEEFAVVLPNTEEVKIVAENIRQAVENLNIPHEASPGGHTVTVSVGCFAANPHEKPNAEVTELMLYADSALYEAKSNGRNRVVVSHGT